MMWRDRSVGKGAVSYADGHLYVLSENNVVGLVEATPTGYREKGRFEIRDQGWPSWAHPAISGGPVVSAQSGNAHHLRHSREVAHGRLTRASHPASASVVAGVCSRPRRRRAASLVRLDAVARARIATARSPAFTAPAAWPEQLTQRWKVEVGTRLRDAARRRQSRLHVLAPRRQRDDDARSMPTAARCCGRPGYPAPFTMHQRHGAARPGTEVDAGRSPTAGSTAIGMTGIVTAFDAASGKQLWQKPGSDAGADVHDARVLADRRRRTA